MAKAPMITYRGHQVSTEWPARIQEAQQEPQYEIQGQTWDRVRYGEEKFRWDSNPCHDCCVLKGEYHAPGCDAEECPRCGHQAISCSCDPPEKDEEEPSG